MTRTEKLAVVFLPAFLVLGAMQILRTGAWPAPAVLVFKAAMLVAAAAAIGALFWARMGTEHPDERERAIQLKSIRMAFGFLVVGVVALSVFSGPTPGATGDIASAMGLLAIAIHNAAVLIYSRRGG